MRRVAFAGLAAVALGVVGSVPAAAAPVRVTSTAGAGVVGPRLAGSSLFFGEAGSKRFVLRLASPGGTRSKVFSLPARSPGSFSDEESPGDFTSFSTYIAASPERLAYSEAFASGNARYQVGNASLTLWGGTASAFGEVARCTIEGIYGPVSAVVDADGPRVVSTGCGGAIAIRDYSGPEPVVRNISPGQGLAAGPIAIAGHFIAFTPYPSTPSGTSPNRTEVRDWVTDTKVYDTPRLESFDLQSDGTLATSTGRLGDDDCSASKLAWYSVAEPVEHVLPVRPCTPDVRIAGGRIAVTALTAGGDIALALVGLDGSRADAATLGSATTGRGAIDYDGERVAYTLGNCPGGTDLMTDSAAAPEPQPIAAPCPVRILSGRADLVAGQRALFADIDCELGCSGSAALRMRVKGRKQTVASRRIRIARPASPPLSCADSSTPIKLPAAARAEIRRKRRTSATLIVTTRDLDGSPRVTTRRLILRAVPRPTVGCL